MSIKESSFLSLYIQNKFSYHILNSVNATLPPLLHLSRVQVLSHVNQDKTYIWMQYFPSNQDLLIWISYHQIKTIHYHLNNFLNPILIHKSICGVRGREDTGQLAEPLGWIVLREGGICLHHLLTYIEIFYFYGNQRYCREDLSINTDDIFRLS